MQTGHHCFKYTDILFEEQCIAACYQNMQSKFTLVVCVPLVSRKHSFLSTIPCYCMYSALIGLFTLKWDGKLTTSLETYNYAKQILPCQGISYHSQDGIQSSAPTHQNFGYLSNARLQITL